MNLLYFLSLALLVPGSWGCGAAKNAEPHQSALNSAVVAEDPSPNPCAFQMGGLENRRGFKIPGIVRLKVPEGTFRYTYSGNDGLPEQEECQVVVDARYTPNCGAEIFGIYNQGRYRNSDGNIDKSGLFAALDPVDLTIPRYAIPHLIRPGLTIKWIPGAGGILNFDDEIKLFGESVQTLTSFEHFQPVFPFGREKWICQNLTLTEKVPFDANPYERPRDL